MSGRSVRVRGRLADQFIAEGLYPWSERPRAKYAVRDVFYWNMFVFSGFLPLHIFFLRCPHLLTRIHLNSRKIDIFFPEFSTVFPINSTQNLPMLLLPRPDRARLYRTFGDLRRQTVRCSGHFSSAPQKDGFPFFSDPEILIEKSAGCFSIGESLTRFMEVIWGSRN